MRRMETIIQLCDAHIATNNFEIGTDLENNTYFDVLTDMAPGYNDTMWYCKWRNVDGPCHAYFRTMITEEGALQFRKKKKHAQFYKVYRSR